MEDTEIRDLAKTEFDKTEYSNYSESALIWSVWKRAFDIAWRMGEKTNTFSLPIFKE